MSNLFHPSSKDIELAVKSFSLEWGSKKRGANYASRIQEVFRANFAPLGVWKNTHFPPAEENCSLGISRTAC